jgi:hypothetical protein
MSGPVTLNSPTIATPTMTGQAVIPSINLTGGQIVFPATQNPSAGANTLDDYEEGTWTPNIGGNATYLNQFGRYVKIGNKVFVEGFVEVNVLGTGLRGDILGLPFTSNTNTPLGTASVGFFANAAGSVSYLSATIGSNGTALNLRHIGAGGATGMGAVTFFQNNTSVFFTANYSV